jgi:hypothetical protein
MWLAGERVRKASSASKTKRWSIAISGDVGAGGRSRVRVGLALALQAAWSASFFWIRGSCGAEEDGAEWFNSKGDQSKDIITQKQS